MERNKLKLVRIMPKTKHKIERLANRRGLKQITVLEYLLNGKIDISELNKHKELK